MSKHNSFLQFVENVNQNNHASVDVSYQDHFTKEEIINLSKQLGVRPEQLLRKYSFVMPDTSAFLKMTNIIDMLLQDFYQVIIPDIVIRELDYQKDHGENRKKAANAMKTINVYTRNTKSVVILPSSKAGDNNDSKMIETIKAYQKAHGHFVSVISEDIGFKLKWDAVLTVQEYIASRNETNGYHLINELDKEFDYFDKYDKALHKNELDSYLENGETLLISAIKCNDRDKVKARGYRIPKEKRMEKIRFLVNHNVSLDKTDCGNYNLTPLAHCMQLNDLEVFTFLVENGADPGKGSIDESTPSFLKVQNKNEGNTPLMIASWHGNLSAVKYITALKDVSVNQTDSNGFTALHKAAVQYARNTDEGKKKKYKAIYDYFMSLNRTDPLIRDRNNKTAKDWLKGEDNEN